MNPREERELRMAQYMNRLTTKQLAALEEDFRIGRELDEQENAERAQACAALERGVWLRAARWLAR